MNNVHVVRATLISKSKNGKGAEVKVIFGEGPQRRSVTRHVIRERKDDDAWVGRNPDEQTEPLRAAASRKVLAAQAIVTETNNILKMLRENNGKLEKLPEGIDMFMVLLIREAAAEIAEVIAGEESNLRIAEELLKNAEKHQEDIERDYPPYVQFTF